jgi:hypothetical protein
LATGRVLGPLAGWDSDRGSTSRREECRWDIDWRERSVGFCTCQAPCPCPFGQEASWGHCEGLIAFAIEQGEVSGVDVAGPSHHGRMVRRSWISGNYTAASILDRRDGEKQRRALQHVFWGELGWDAAHLAGLIGTMLGGPGLHRSVPARRLPPPPAPAWDGPRLRPEDRPAVPVGRSSTGVAFAAYCAGCYGPLLCSLLLFAAASSSFVVGGAVTAGIPVAMALPIGLLGWLGHRSLAWRAGSPTNYALIRRASGAALAAFGVLLAGNHALMSGIELAHRLGV